MSGHAKLQKPNSDVSVEALRMARQLPDYLVALGTPYVSLHLH